MALESGIRLGSYEVLAAIGVGGMGEVYRARDTRLNRDVALKVLPDAFTIDPDRLARFRREAQLLASLSHPNIGAIYGFEEWNGVQTLVLELVEGLTLADRLARGAMSIDEALPIARQIAEAIESAHDVGIVHRDLKPSNIKLKVRGDATSSASDVTDCTVKVLDFGLAKALEPMVDGSGTVLSSPTITSPALTQMGVVLGTAAYMSPEQAKGRPADKRSDVWAFGAVLFEMLSGERPFKGDDVADTVAAVLRAEPQWNALPQNTPHGVRRLLRRCLQKDPKRRFQHMGDVRLELVEVEEGELVHEETLGAPSRRRIWPLVAAAAAGVVVTGVAAYVLAPAPAIPPMTRFAVQIPATALTAGRSGGIAFHPDGRSLVYGFLGVSPGLVRRRLDDVTLEPLRGGEGGASPFFSPDGAWIGFFAGGKLKKIPAAGGTSIEICDVPVNGVAAWGDDDTIVVARGHLFRVPASGGTLEKVLDGGDEQFSQPEFLPGSRAILVHTRIPPAAGRIEAIELQTRARHIITEGETPKLAPAGELLFAREGRLWAMKFDARQFRGVGAEKTLASLWNFDREPQLYAVSRDGSLAYLSVGGQSLGSIVWLDRSGKATPALDVEERPFVYPRLSPDEKRVAVSLASLAGDSGNLFTYDLERGFSSQLTTDGINRRTIWSPDGAQIAYFSLSATPLPGASQELFVMPSTGGAPKPLLTRPGPQWPDSWSPDGRFLIFETGETGASRDLWVLPIGGEPRALVATRFNERGAVFSPDGGWFAFTSDQSGRSEVYVAPFPGPGQPLPISKDGGTEPVWAKTDRELFYRNGDSLMFTKVQLKPFSAAVPRKLFDLPMNTYPVDNFHANYDVTKDGRFIAVRRVRPSVMDIHFILNWTEELRRALGR
jgi:WD40 repeat protein